MARNVVSDRMLAANRANALKSTGPRTPAGKACSRLNGLKSGILARECFMAPQDAADFDRLHADLRADFPPASQYEAHLVLRLAQIIWRLRLCLIYENASIRRGQAALESPTAEPPAATPALDRFRDPAAQHHKPQPISGPDTHWLQVIRQESVLSRYFHLILDRLTHFANYRAETAAARGNLPDVSAAKTAPPVNDADLPLLPPLGAFKRHRRSKKPKTTPGSAPRLKSKKRSSNPLSSTPEPAPARPQSAKAAGQAQRTGAPRAETPVRL